MDKKQMIYALHGAVGMAADWKDFAQVMKADGLSVARVDLWKFLACCPMPIGEFGAAFNKEVHAKEAVLLGYSMGGRLALHALLDAPDKWQKAIIVSAHTGLAESERIPRQSHDAAWAAKALKWDWDTFLGEWNSQGVLEGAEMADRRKLKPQRESVARSFMDWTVGLQQDLLPRLKEITCPVLWIVGARDEKFLAVARVAVQMNDLIQLEIVDDCGHRVPWEQPEVFSGLVSKFLNKKSV
ncbi:alpha/beta fold hydrolase [Rubritalea sp.]|uniref:alpha/beta fold hydrolase n=1 Tax=Rubritalea sp. TaxID=2109375 RepID=UPI003EF0EAF9